MTSLEYFKAAVAALDRLDGQGAITKRIAFAEFELVVSLTLTRTVLVAERDLKTVLSMQTSVKGRKFVNTIELQPLCRAEDVDDAVRGFIHSVESERAFNLFATAHYCKAGDNIMFSEKLEQGSLICTLRQRQVLKQTLANACGYHALYNTLDMLDGTIYCEQTYLGLWENIFLWMRILHDYNDKVNMWSKDGICSGAVDQVQMEYIVKHDPRLENRVFVFGSKEDMVESECLKQSAGPAVKAFLVGCITHWTVFVVNGIGSKNAVITFADSFNKPSLQFVPGIGKDSLVESDRFESVEELSGSVMEKYRPSFARKMRKISSHYEHLPESEIEKMYVEGVPEYWKGSVKDRLYWNHRALADRIYLLNIEMESVLGYVGPLLGWLEGMISTGYAVDNRSAPNSSSCLRELGIIHKREVREPKKKYPSVITNLSSSSETFRSYIRREEDWPEDSEEYKRGNKVENRKKPPLEEVAGDVFDRQRVIVGFDQCLIENQVCLVVGTGGIGQNVALNLARLGVGHIILLDYDQVDASNLTRQCLSGIEDVGIPKVDAAQVHLENCHQLNSRVTVLDVDVVKSWDTVVSLAKESTVVFNCVDIGVLFDFCINDLAKEIGLPLVSGQSFAWKFMTEFYTGHPEKNCAFCTETTKGSFGVFDVDTILSRLNVFLGTCDLTPKSLFDFMRDDPQFRISGEIAKELVECALTRTGKKARPDPEWLKAFLLQFHDLVIDCLCGKITNYMDLSFVPRPIYPPTRYFGSWVGPCLTCGAMMVAHWANSLTGPTGRNPPTNMVFNLDEGMTAEEQMGYEIGMALDKADRSFAQTPSDERCSVCKMSQRADNMKRLLFGGGADIYLKPTQKGKVLAAPRFRPNCGDKPCIVSCVGREDLVFPAVPANAPLMDCTASYACTFPLLPSSLSSSPLVKCTEAEATSYPRSIHGLASGVRSAIVWENFSSPTYRLKGCGNHHEGFPVETHGDFGEKMVRGCLFENTAAREMYMNDLITKALQEHAPQGFPCANRALGFYQYDMQEFDVPVSTYCVLFETLGDRRLGDHLLSGLERLIPRLYPHVQGETWLKEIQEHIKRGRGIEEGSSEELWDTSMVAECGMQVANMSTIDLVETVSGLEADEPSGRFGALWRETVSNLKQSLESEPLGTSMLMALAKQIGSECGTVCHVLEKRGISWGTYPDKTGIHCNAHANNMVVCDPLSLHQSTTCLAPLDFDMAFTKESFLPEVVKGFHQTGFPCEWDELVKWEQAMGMRPSLAGSDFTSTGVSNEKVASNENRVCNMIHLAFRDTIVHAYDNALISGSRGEMRFLHPGTSYLILLALILSQENTT
mmetsp:Transcript_8733/g.16229  ORF Transcript_8733/g.16229 Transcript_8733/m.16229 type:complete len:1331 (-) Transcript_8733:1773-5765(-)